MVLRLVNTTIVAGFQALTWVTVYNSRMIIFLLLLLAGTVFEQV